MLFHVLAGSNNSNKLVDSLITNTLGDSSLIYARDLLYSFIDKAEKAYKDYVNNRASIKIYLTPTEIDDLITIGLDKDLLFNVMASPEPTTNVYMNHPDNLDVAGEYIGLDVNQQLKKDSLLILKDQAYKIINYNSYTKPSGGRDLYAKEDKSTNLGIIIAVIIGAALLLRG